MGTAELARVVLGVLARDGRWEIAGVVVQPDKPVGRGMRVQAPPVKQEAEALGLRVLQPARARDPGFVEALTALAPDVVVVAAYGQILPVQVLAVPRFGCLNVHTSILPRWRGAAPITWAILEGDVEAGVTIMRMDAGLDTGDMLAVERTPIRPDDTGQTLHDRLAVLGAELMRRVLPEWLSGTLTPVPQPADGATYARKLVKEDGRMDWAQSVARLDRQVRALNPWPGAFTTMPVEGGAVEMLKVWEAEPMEVAVADRVEAGVVGEARGEVLWVGVGDGTRALKVRVLQREGRRRMTAREFLAGGGLRPGVRLGV